MSKLKKQWPLYSLPETNPIWIGSVRTTHGPPESKVEISMECLGKCRNYWFLDVEPYDLSLRAVVTQTVGKSFQWHASSLVRVPPMLVYTCSWASMLVATKPAGVAPEVNLRNPGKHTSGESILALKPREDFTRSSKQGYRWLRERTNVLQNLLEKRK